ncbi:MAG: hypothetical protein Q9161_009057 [Pseudevernia consocians]
MEAMESNSRALSSKVDEIHLSVTSLRSVGEKIMGFICTFPNEVRELLQSIVQADWRTYQATLQIQERLAHSPTTLHESNIRFTNVLGEYRELPYEYFCQWEPFEGFLRAQFRNKPGENKVLKDQFYIIDAKDNRKIIRKEHWSRSIFQVSEDDVARRQIEDDLRLYGSRPEPPDTVEVDEYSQLANLPLKRNASDFEAADDRPAKLRKKRKSKEFNYQTLTVMDWNAGVSPLDARLNQSAVPSTAAALDQQESTNPVSHPLTQEIDEIKVFRNVHMAIAPSPKHTNPPLEPVEGLDFGAQIYYRNIMDRFPVIPRYLASRLSQANCDRAERLRREKESAQTEYEVDERTWHTGQRELEERRNDEGRKAENIEKLNSQIQILQGMIDDYKTNGFVMPKSGLIFGFTGGFTSPSESPACLEFWERRFLPSHSLKIEHMEQELRVLEADKQCYHWELASSNGNDHIWESTRMEQEFPELGADMQCYHWELTSSNGNDHSWKSFQLQQASQNRDDLLLDHVPSPSSLPSQFAVSATTLLPLAEDCRPPPPVHFWTHGSRSSRPASVHSRSSSMNSSLHGSPVFDPQEQDLTFASKLPASTAGSRQSFPALPPAPVELGKLNDIRDAYAKIKNLAKSFHEDVPLRPLSDFQYDGKNAVQTLMSQQHKSLSSSMGNDLLGVDVKENMDNYLGSLKEGKVKSLRELVDWNSAHAEEALTKEYPNQELLEKGLTFGDSVETREKLTAHAEAVAASFDEVVSKYDIDVIIAPGDCMLSEYAAAGGQSSLYDYIFLPFTNILT